MRTVDHPASDPEESGRSDDALAEIGDRPDNLYDAARLIVSEPVTRLKVLRARAAARLWFRRELSKAPSTPRTPLADRPGRPSKPDLLAPRDMPRRSASGTRGRFALMHSLAHIELNAVDMTWDLVARFIERPMPRTFFDNWVQVGLEEAKHFDLLDRRLRELGGAYGDLPAHDGLWQAAAETGHDLLARLAIVPLVLEARGLDVTPPMIAKLRSASDDESADILEIIYRDEKRHVAFGTRWFTYVCAREKRIPEPTFHQMVQRYFRGGLRPPFNDRARSEAGLTPGFYKPLSSIA
ncbi:MAG: ferritin-like domain-containing protein [Pseudomonadota bacterium]